MSDGIDFNNEEQVKKIADSLCENDVLNVSPVDGGRNSRIFRVKSGNLLYALKFFRSDNNGSRNRWEAETTALELFAERGITSTPKVVAKNKENNCVLIEWIEGKKISDYGTEEIDDIIGFVEKVHDIVNHDKDQEVRRATDATLSGNDIIRQINARLERIKPSQSVYPQLDEFIVKEFIPVFNEISAWSKDEYQRCGLNFNEDIALKQQTLSIVDFGFHNCLRKNNKYYFLDFEFFGWDDPAKLVADTLQHPGLELNDEKKQTFFSGFNSVFGGDEAFLTRLKLLYPLFGLKWCMIMLNPFQPGYQLLDSDANAQRSKQLARVKSKTKKIHETFKELPYVQYSS